MKKYLLAVATLLVVLPACQRTSREMWEDTKSAKRYVGRGLRSLMGHHSDGSSFAYMDDWAAEDDSQTVLALSDADLYDSPGMKDMGAGGIPLSKESPGDPGSPLPGVDGFLNPSGELATLFRNIHFETDHYTVKGKENLETLNSIAQYLASHQRMYVFVEGHADERGAAAYNLALGSRRANSIRTFLVQNGVSPDQLFTISYGKEHPLVAGHDENSWSENRRAQFKLYER